MYAPTHARMRRPRANRPLRRAEGLFSQVPVFKADYDALKLSPDELIRRVTNITSQAVGFGEVPLPHSSTANRAVIPYLWLSWGKPDSWHYPPHHAAVLHV